MREASWLFGIQMNQLSEKFAVSSYRAHLNVQQNLNLKSSSDKGEELNSYLNRAAHPDCPSSTSAIEDCSQALSKQNIY